MENCFWAPLEAVGREKPTDASRNLDFAVVPRAGGEVDIA